MTPQECHKQVLDILGDTSNTLGAHFLQMIADSLEVAQEEVIKSRERYIPEVIASEMVCHLEDYYLPSAIDQYLNLREQDEPIEVNCPLGPALPRLGA